MAAFICRFRSLAGRATRAACTGRAVAAALLALPAVPLAGAQTAPAQQLRAAEPWVCTAIPRRFWLPISVLSERLAEQGLTVVEAVETRDDCYAIRLRDRERNERTVIFDPVSAKPLR